MVNQDIRLKAAGSGVKLWKIAEKLGVADSNFSRRLRKEMSQEEKSRILEIVEDLAKEVQ